MRRFNGFSYMLAVLVIFLGIGSRKIAFAEEKCLENRNSIFGRRDHLYDQDFGLTFSPDDFLTSMMSPFMLRDYYRPWRYLKRAIGSTIKTDKDKFQINLDVQHFRPDEITVKTADGYIVVEGKHEEKEDEHGLVSRQFVRRYSLPEGVEPEKVVSQLSSDGVLSVSAPIKATEARGERLIPITQTGPVRKESKESQASCDQETCLESNG